MAYPTNSRQHPLLRAAVLTALSLSLLAGCKSAPVRDYAAEGAVWKARIAEAYERNDSLDNFKFDGHFSYEASEPTKAADAPNGVLPTLADGLAWSGVWYREPLRLEAELRLGEAETAPSMPFLVQDDKLYVHIPSLNRQDEYFSVDLSANEADGPLPIEPLVRAAGAFDELAKAVVERVDPAWVRAADGSAPPAEGEGTRDETGVEAAEAEAAANRLPDVFVVEATPDNAEHLASAFRDGYAAWSSAFPDRLGASQAAFLDETLRVGEGSVLRIALDEAGYIVEQSIDWTFVRAQDGEASSSEAAPASEPAVEARLAYAARLAEPNGAPAMNAVPPSNVLPLEHVLAFLKAGQAQTPAP
ncbi:hypothetical protein [Paenibacillus sp.]|uniref:hypothetical protein n=1 Tax=Paenibacillus sp. TaxID=58172 RepID=UPI002D4A601C|nr:hypothetical protein [Paenibacillus sp.]HZG55897.1 hypothetical protein [Paenibacillus sp.]